MLHKTGIITSSEHIWQTVSVTNRQCKKVPHVKASVGHRGQYVRLNSLPVKLCGRMMFVQKGTEKKTHYGYAVEVFSKIKTRRFNFLLSKMNSYKWKTES